VELEREFMNPRVDTLNPSKTDVGKGAGLIPAGFFSPERGKESLNE
jgi:hypothetical protein